MLKKLTIQNFVIAESLEIDFSTGLCVLTGETGAGKSLILDAILGVLGQRLPVDTIRQGAEFAYLEAVFELTDAVREILLQRAYEEFLDADSLTLSKTIHKTGSRSRLNGQLVTQALIRDLSACLVDSIGQHENQALFHEERHLSMLDALGDVTYRANLKALSHAYHQLLLSQRELTLAQEEQREGERQQDFLSFQWQEIQDAQLDPDEELGLEAERDRLRHAEKLLTAVGQASTGLSEHQSGPGVSEQLEGVQRLLSGASRYDSKLETWIEQLETVLIQIQDLSSELNGYCDQVEHNPERLNELEARQALLQKLRHKYGEDIPAILGFAQQLEAQLQAYERSAENFHALEQAYQTTLVSYRTLAQQVHQARQHLARDLAPKIEAELKDLGMAKTRFSVDLAYEPERLHEHGLNRAQFLLSPNPGEPLRPLARIASGGEASRLLLAFKLVLKDACPVATLIFDEVDAGISGKAALVVSQKLARLAREQQVLCISHLPVIAAIADQQLWIEKHMRQQDTRIQITTLTQEQRLERLAQMGAGQVTDSSLEGAREIVAHAQVFKQELEPLLPSAC